MKKITNGYNTVDVETPINGRVFIMDTYWLCKDGDPKQAIFFKQTTQCNKHLSIPERMLKHTKEKTGWDIEVVFMPVAYRPQIVHWQNV